MAAPAVIRLQGLRSGPQTVGDMLRLGIVVTDPATGNEVDPTTVRFKYIEPSARTATTITYAASPPGPVVKSDVGVYYTNFDLSEAGVYAVRWELDGTYVAATEFNITVAPSRF